MEHFIAFPAVAAVSAGLVVGSIAMLVMVGRAERPARRLTLACVGLLALESALLSLAFGRSPVWMEVLDSLGVLLCLLALALQFGSPRPLSSWAEGDIERAEPTWWPEFEHAFWRHVAAPREDPLRAAAARRREGRA